MAACSPRRMSPSPTQVQSSHRSGCRGHWPILLYGCRTGGKCVGPFLGAPQLRASVWGVSEHSVAGLVQAPPCLRCLHPSWELWDQFLLGSGLWLCAHTDPWQLGFPAPIGDRTPLDTAQLAATECTGAGVSQEEIVMSLPQERIANHIQDSTAHSQYPGTMPVRPVAMLP